MTENVKEWNYDKPDQSGNNNQEYRLVLICGGQVTEFTLSGRQILGRKTPANFPDLEAESLIVSRTHGEFITKDGHIEYQDLGSKNGTFIDGHKIPARELLNLKDGSVLRIQAGQLDKSVKDVLLVVEKRFPEKAIWKKIVLSGRLNQITVGREEEIPILDRTASRNHASFSRVKNGWAIVDNNSLNGVYLNGKRIHEPVLLEPLDVVRIAKHLFIFCKNEIIYQADDLAASEPESVVSSVVSRQDLKVVEEKNSKEKHGEQEEKGEDNSPEKIKGKSSRRKITGPAGEKPGVGQKSLKEQIPGDDAQNYPEDPSVHKKKRTKDNRDKKILSIHIQERVIWNRLRRKAILKGIDLSVESGSLVLILGGSGAGKTTFMNAVMGYEPATGTVSYDGSDIYRDYEKMKYEIGYVPQQDLLRMEDIVYDTLENAARMRLPEELFLTEGVRYVEYTLNMFGLTRERNTLVGKLSGGQRKRLSIAVEYIGNPSLFFLDEPDSGLDGTMARSLMTNLRQIADQNKIVMVISHSPDRAFELFDKVIVLAKSSVDDCGRLVYYGTPTAACEFFETNSLEEIITRINRKDEGGEGLADLFIQKFANERYI